MKEGCKVDVAVGAVNGMIDGMVKTAVIFASHAGFLGENG